MASDEVQAARVGLALLAMYPSDPLEANVWQPDPPDEDGPTYLDEDAEPALDEIEDDVPVLDENVKRRLMERC